MCTQLSLQQANALATREEFAQAARVLLTQTDRCRGQTHPETRQVLEHVATLHVQHAAVRCDRREHENALREFEDIATLAYPEQILREAKSEDGWCRLTVAHAFANDQWFDEALEQLSRDMSTDNTVRTAALRQAPPVVEQQIEFWLAPRQYAKAFAMLKQQRDRFGHEPEMAMFFLRLESQIDLSVFGRVLAQPCTTKAKGKPRGP